MRKNKTKHKSCNQQQQQCFFANDNENNTEIQVQNRSRQTQDVLQINDYDQIRKSLPSANQLVHYHRPKQMKARVMSVQGKFQKLPNYMDEPCIQDQSQLQPNTQNICINENTGINIGVNFRPKLNNKQKLTLAQYLCKKQFITIYTKNIQSNTNNNNNSCVSFLQNTQIKQSINSMTVRLRTITQVSDYNCKQFKQLTQYKTRQQSGKDSKNQQKKNSYSQRQNNKYQDYANNQSIRLNDRLIQYSTVENVRNQYDQIDSNFQCGNLAKAYFNTSVNNAKIYYLLLQQDTNTHGYTNWFFFRLKNLDKGIRKFYILNMVKRTSFYRQGMKISIFSRQNYKKNGKRWFKGGKNISFFQTNFMRQEHNDYFNCLYFQYDFQVENDQVYFAVSQPYTYTRMANLVNSIKQKQHQNAITQVSCKVQIISYSIANNIIPSLTFSLKNGIQSQNKKQHKKSIVILGRQHPSQVAGSFISQYLIKYFAQQNYQAKMILNKFNVIIIPMINPDGVIYGNSRSNLTGFDLNRHWGSQIIKELTPQTYKIRSFLSQLQKSNRHIKFLLDVHGHGKKLNSFLFCCKKQNKISNRQFPLVLSKFQQRFQLLSCTYGISRDKQNTVRAQLNDIGISDCYTLENSYFGYAKDRNKDLQKQKDKQKLKADVQKQKQKNKLQIVCYNQNDYKSIAQSIIKSLYVFFSTQKNQKQQIKQKYGWNIDSINQQLSKIVDKLERYQKNMIQDEDLMSQSDPQGDGLNLQERLKICTNSKVLDKKIRDSFKKGKKLQKQIRSKNFQKSCNKNAKIKTQPLQTKQENQQQQDIKILQKKIEGKLILSKKLKYQNKIKSTNRQRKSMLQSKRQSTQQDESKLVKKMLNKPFNPFKTPKQTPSSRFLSTQYNQPSKTSVMKTQPYQRCKMYQKLKTQINQFHCFSAMDIDQQNQRKQKKEEELNKLQQQNLKNVVKQSLLFMQHSNKSKKCKFISQKRDKKLASTHLIQAKFHSFSMNLDGPNETKLNQRKSQSNFNKNFKIVRSVTEDNALSLPFKKTSELRAKPKRSYHRFQMFRTNQSLSHKFTNQQKNSIFYHFPVM